MRPSRYDVAVVGGGPAGAATAWSLARRGARVVVLDRERFPREKVCGDFVEPRGLRIIERMGAAPALAEIRPLPITHVAIFVESSLAYRGAIPFYGTEPGLPPHGYIVPRDQLDVRLLGAARAAGATVREGCTVSGFECTQKGVELHTRIDARHAKVQARFIVGADGASSLVARQAGLYREDVQHTAVSQRCYATHVRLECGEAAFLFDTDLFPGYGWMFPMRDCMANIGVGILSETRQRRAVSVPALFKAFEDKLRHCHPGCRDLQTVGKTLGGIVRTYGAAGCNHFERGLLVGDAGCFVDPMTGEGITPALESGLIAASILAHALDAGNAGTRCLPRFEREFRRYFDPAMRYLILCAEVMRNPHLSEFWLRATRMGCQEAAADPHFARVAGATFGGLDIQPAVIVSQIWLKIMRRCGGLLAQPLLGNGGVPGFESSDWAGCLQALRAGWWHSLVEDPWWHGMWTADVCRRWLDMASAPPFRADPRLQGPIAA
jgi:menaquinone-9 beta-reductase